MTPARTRNGDRIAIPRWSGGVGGREAVRGVGVEEVGEIHNEGHAAVTAMIQWRRSRIEEPNLWR